MKGRAFGSTGMIEIRVKRKAKKYKDGILLGSVIAPPFIGLLFLDVFGKHPGAGLAYILGMIVWDICFAVANRKKPRAATRGKETKHSTVKDFRAYLITERDVLSNEEDIAS